MKRVGGVEGGGGVDMGRRDGERVGEGIVVKGQFGGVLLLGLVGKGWVRLGRW